MKKLPKELELYILSYVYGKCDICFKDVSFWDLYEIKKIYNIQLLNNDYKFVYLFLNSEKKACNHCYCLLKYWFRY